MSITELMNHLVATHPIIDGAFFAFYSSADGSGEWEVHINHSAIEPALEPLAWSKSIDIEEALEQAWAEYMKEEQSYGE